MNTLVKASCLSMLLVSSLAFSSTQTTNVFTGTLHISGRVVAAPCTITQPKIDAINLECQKQHKAVHQTIDMKNINKLHEIKNDNKTAIRVDYLNDSHTLVLVNVIYN